MTTSFGKMKNANYTCEVVTPFLSNVVFDYHLVMTGKRHLVAENAFVSVGSQSICLPDASLSRYKMSGKNLSFWTIQRITI
jgi:hypothetical protein